MADAGMTIFVRSVFLQGLIFFKPDELDPRMDFCRPYLTRFYELCREFSLTPPELALSFVLSLDGIASVVLGCQTVEQTAENCQMTERARKLTDEEMRLLHSAFHDIDPRVIDPRKWYNKF